MFPLLIFAREEFDIKIFYRKILTYAFIIAIFYIIDSHKEKHFHTQDFIPPTTNFIVTRVVFPVNILMGYLF